jgi:hypothetical protein
VRLDPNDLVVASFETGSVRYGNLTVPTVDTSVPTATVTVCNRCPPDTKDCA